MVITCQVLYVHSTVYENEINKAMEEWETSTAVQNEHHVTI